MNILIVGAGAVGGVYGGLLTKSGNDVTFLARGENLSVLRHDGLRVRRSDGTSFQVHPRVVDIPEDSYTADVALFCVKSYQTHSAIEAMSGAIEDNTTVLTLQNGIGSGSLLSAAFGEDNILLGAAYVDAVRTKLGEVLEENAPARIIFGESNRKPSERLEAISSLLATAEIKATVSQDIESTLWAKLIYICALSGMSCLLREPFRKILDFQPTRSLTLSLMQEVVVVARAKGVNLKENIEIDIMDAFLLEEGFVSSMYLDLVAGLPLEIDVLNGVVCKFAEEFRVATPINNLITSCLSYWDTKARLKGI